MDAGTTSGGEVTRLLEQVRAGEDGAVDRLFPVVYEELRRLARHQMQRVYRPSTLQATGLVHEAYMKLAGGAGVPAESRAHFLSIAARAMRQVLVDQARQKAALKRGGGWTPTTLGEGQQALALGADEMLALHDAIERLEPRQRRIVEGRFFAGLDEQQLATLLGVSDRTIRREWVKARAWLVRALAVAQPSDASPGG